MNLMNEFQEPRTKTKSNGMDEREEKINKEKKNKN